jgi:hypothetical protein
VCEEERISCVFVCLGLFLFSDLRGKEEKKSTMGNRRKRKKKGEFEQEPQTDTPEGRRGREEPTG